MVQNGTGSQALSWKLKYKAEEGALSGQTFTHVITKQWSAWGSIPMQGTPDLTCGAQVRLGGLHGGSLWINGKNLEGNKIKNTSSSET